MAEAYRHLVISEEPPIGIVELNRKRQLNALSMALRDELEGCLGSVESDDRIKAVILTGGPECFSAGFDLKEVIETDFRAFGHRAVEFTERTYHFKKPLVTAVAGVAYAGGFDLALSGDVIVAAENASLGRPEVRFGINPLMAKLWLRIGMARALHLSLTGEFLTAQQALALGLVDRVVPAEQLLDAAREEARRLSQNPLPALVAVKRAARTVPFLELRSAVEYEFGLTAEIIAEGSVKSSLAEYARALGIIKG
ncbi:MAG: enoyl-CoA hydratase/isomerase family protein [Candidatus Rokubacteria bacterium]|nr:enoyl-CoA hydratase/isomerase family protein [Candidatus Rokubacteria bacterium]